MFVLVTSLCLAFFWCWLIEFDFVLMTSAYSQYLRESCKQHLALIGSQSDIWVYLVIVKMCPVWVPTIWNYAPSGPLSKILELPLYSTQTELRIARFYAHTDIVLTAVFEVNLGYPVTPWFASIWWCFCLCCIKVWSTRRRLKRAP